MIAPLMPINN